MDTAPPVITLLDPPSPYRPGQDYSTGGGGGGGGGGAPSGFAAGGATGRITYILAATPFTDPGAT